MLVLSRREQERFRVGPTIITVLRSNGSVKLGIEAPDDLEIQREELEDDFEAQAICANAPTEDHPHAT